MVTERISIKEMQKMKAERLNQAFQKMARAVQKGTLKQVAPPITA